MPFARTRSCISHTNKIVRLSIIQLGLQSVARWTSCSAEKRPQHNDSIQTTAAAAGQIRVNMATLSSSGEVTQPEIMKEVLQGLCRPIGGPALRSLIDAHFDDNVVLKNPFFSVKGKDQLYHFFHGWSGLFDDRLQVLDVASHGSRVMVKVRHNLLMRPFHMAKHAMPALAMELLTVPLIVNSEVDTMQTARGLRITRWVEDVSVYTLIFNLVWPTKLYNFWDYVESAVGQGIVLADQVASQCYHMLQPRLAPHADRALRSADSLLKERLGLDARLSSASSKFWT